VAEPPDLSPDEPPTDPHLRVPEGSDHHSSAPPGHSAPVTSRAPPPVSEAPASVPARAPAAAPVAAPAAVPRKMPAFPQGSLLRTAAPLSGGHPLPARSSTPPPLPLRQSVPPPLPPRNGPTDFTMPRPSAPPAAAPSPAKVVDAGGEWRERLASVEVQVSATRATSQRAANDIAALRERTDATVTRLDTIDQSLRAALASIGDTARAALARAEAPPDLQRVESKIAQLETIASAARAASAALREELAENKRLAEARGTRIASLDTRLGKLECDPRPAELRLALDRIEARILASEREQGAIKSRLDALEQRPSRSEEDAAPRASERPSGDALASVTAEIAELRAAIATMSATAAARGESAGAARSPFAGITGIGPKIQTKLAAAGVPDAAGLAAIEDPERDRIARAIGVKRDKLDGWIDAARRGR
jgi:predicted flap endonuclease-1-like 5' DNA nuclease